MVKKHSTKKIMKKQSYKKSAKKIMKKQSYKRSISKKSPARRSSSKRSSRRSSSRRSSSRRSSSKRSSRRSSRRSSSKRSSRHSSKVSSHYRTIKKTRVKSHYRMRGMGNLLQMYGGASEELEAEHNSCLVKYKELMDSHSQVSQLVDDMRSGGSSKSEINEQISKANGLRDQIADLVDGAGKCKEKQAALLESLKDVAHNVTEQLNNEIEQRGGNAAEVGANLDKFALATKAKAHELGTRLSSELKSAGQNLSNGLKSAGTNLSSGLKSAGANIKEKYNNYRDKKSQQKRNDDLSYCEKTFSKGELASGFSSTSSI